MSLRVVVAEDSLLMRAGIVQVLGLAADLDVVAECGDLDQLRDAVAATDPDVVVTDVRMPPGQDEEGITAAVELRAQRAVVGVVVLSQYAEPAYANALFDGGSARRAYLLKDRISQSGQLADAVRTVAAGGSVVDPAVVDLLVGASSRSSAGPLSTLTRREREVLELVAQGMSNGGVARTLVLTERAVEKHINALFPKLGLEPSPDVNRRVTAVLLLLSDRGPR